MALSALMFNAPNLPKVSEACPTIDTYVNNLVTLHVAHYDTNVQMTRKIISAS